MQKLDTQLTTKLVCIGDFAWDVVIHSQQDLASGGDADGTVSLMPGGSAANVSVWFARIAGRGTAKFIGRVGKDRLGDLARNNLCDEGVIDCINVDEKHATQAVAVFVDCNGQRSCITDPGAADHHLSINDVSADAFEKAKFLHLTSWSLFRNPAREAAVYSARRAHEMGVLVSVDPSSFQKIGEMGAERYLEIISQIPVSFIFPNIDEALEMITGVDEVNNDGIMRPESAIFKEEWLTIASKLGLIFSSATILLKLGRNGVLLYSSSSSGDGKSKCSHICLTDSELRMCLESTHQKLDTIGCGDSFAAAFLAFLSNSQKELCFSQFERASKFACFLSAYVAYWKGARPEMTEEFKKHILHLQNFSQ